MSLTKATYSMVVGAPINVLDYGATGDGVTDDWSAIMDAIIYCNLNGKPLYFPAGTYVHSKPLYLSCRDKALANASSDGVNVIDENTYSNNALMMYGDGKRTTIFKYTGDKMAMLLGSIEASGIGGGAGGVTYTDRTSQYNTLSDFKIESDTADYGLVCGATMRSTFERIEIEISNGKNDLWILSNYNTSPFSTGSIWNVFRDIIIRTPSNARSEYGIITEGSANSNSFYTIFSAEHRFAEIKTTGTRCRFERISTEVIAENTWTAPPHYHMIVEGGCVIASFECEQGSSGAGTAYTKNILIKTEDHVVVEDLNSTNVGNFIVDGSVSDAKYIFYPNLNVNWQANPAYERQRFVSPKPIGINAATQAAVKSVTKTLSWSAGVFGAFETISSRETNDSYIVPVALKFENSTSGTNDFIAVDFFTPDDGWANVTPAYRWFTTDPDPKLIGFSEGMYEFFDDIQAGTDRRIQEVRAQGQSTNAGSIDVTLYYIETTDG